MSIISLDSAEYWAKLFTQNAKLIVGTHDGDEYYYTDENYDEWNGNDDYSSDYNSDDMGAMMETFLTWGLLLMMYAGLTALGFFVFPPFVICLAVTGGALSTCSFEIWSGQ